MAVTSKDEFLLSGNFLYYDVKCNLHYQLISLAGDGCIILWKVNIQSRKMEITQQFTLPASTGKLSKGIGNCGGRYQTDV